MFARPSFRESGAAVADDVYPGTKHNGASDQSALCIWSRKGKAKLVVPICFGTKTSGFWLIIISCSSLESELSFGSKDSEKTSSAFDNCEITAWSFESTLQYFKRRWGRPLCRRAADILGMES